MNEDEKFLAFSRQLLTQSLDELDDSILLKLRQNRQQAVNASLRANKPAVFSFPSWLAPVSTGATFATIALTMTLFWMQPLSQYHAQEYFVEDIPLLSVSEELEFYQNLEFYLWLEDETAS